MIKNKFNETFNLYFLKILLIHYVLITQNFWILHLTIQYLLYYFLKLRLIFLIHQCQSPFIYIKIPFGFCTILTIKIFSFHKLLMIHKVIDKPKIIKITYIVILISSLTLTKSKPLSAQLIVIYLINSSKHYA